MADKDVAKEKAEEELDEEMQQESKEEEAENSELNEAIEKAKAFEDKYVRLFAEFDNYKKRTQREKDARYGDAVIDTVSALLEVADNLERAVAIEVTDEEAKKLLDGVVLVNKQLHDTFEKIGVKEIKAQGEQFDPNLHEAVMHVDDETVDDNTVVEEFRKGYIYKDTRVVRHSMVKVAN